MNLILKRSGRHQWKKPLTSGKESILQQDFNFFIIGSGGADRWGKFENVDSAGQLTPAELIKYVVVVVGRRWLVNPSRVKRVIGSLAPTQPNTSLGYLIIPTKLNKSLGY